jgi:hypothetical protein
LAGGYSGAKSDFDRESLQFFQGLAKDFVRDALKEAGVTAEIAALIDTDISQAIINTAAGYDLIIIGASNEWAVPQHPSRQGGQSRIGVGVDGALKRLIISASRRKRPCVSLVLRRL